MAEDKKNELQFQYYGIEFKILTDVNISTKDIQSFSIVRAPMHKSSAFAILTCAIDKISYIVIEDNIRQNKTMLCEVHISKVDHEKVVKGDSTRREEIKHLMTKTYYIDFCKAIPESSIGKNQDSLMPIINFFLVNPAIWYLSNRKRYNFLFANKTAMECLTEIEASISKDYKDTFNFKDFKIGIEPNKYKYEQILARSSNDLSVPINIINNYKPINQPSYYFFDDFYYTDTLTSNFIPVFFVNLTKQTGFQKLDVSDNKWRDFFVFNKCKNVMPVRDSSNFFKNDSKQEHVVKVDSNNKLIFQENKSKSSIPNFKGKNEKEKDTLDYGRYSFTQSFSFQQEVKDKANDVVKVYAPEKNSHDSAIDRYNICSDFYRNQIHAICTFEAERSFIDLLQFNRCYNLDASDVSDFAHVPIMIVNTFYKINNPDKFYRHSVKYQTIQFKPSVKDGPTLSNA
jgi:hypothetical protein